jgi:hypothetical protein
VERSFHSKANLRRTTTARLETTFHLQADKQQRQRYAIIKILAEHKAGEILSGIERVRNRKQGGDGISSLREELKVSWNTFHNWQLIATVPVSEITAL